MPLDPGLDRMSSYRSFHLDLVSWAETYGLVDIWHWKNPKSRGYTCHSATYKTFSCIDLAYVGGPHLARVRNGKILPQGISDHAPPLVQISLSQDAGEKLWRHPRFWIVDSEVDNAF